MKRRGILIDVVGPLLDGRSAVRRTLLEFVGGLGLSLRPGAEDAVEGGTAGWVLETLLGGHGRDASPADAAALAGAWARTVSRECAVRSGVSVSLDALASAGHEVGLLAAVPHEAVPPPLSGRLVAGADRDGTGAPRPTAVRTWLADHALEGRDVIAVVASPASLLAVSAARIGCVLCHGDAAGLGVLPSDGTITTLDQLGDWLR